MTRDQGRGQGRTTARAPATSIRGLRRMWNSSIATTETTAGTITSGSRLYAPARRQLIDKAMPTKPALTTGWLGVEHHPHLPPPAIGAARGRLHPLRSGP